MGHKLKHAMIRPIVSEEKDVSRIVNMHKDFVILRKAIAKNLNVRSFIDNPNITDDRVKDLMVDHDTTIKSINDDFRQLSATIQRNLIDKFCISVVMNKKLLEDMNLVAKIVCSDDYDYIDTMLRDMKGYNFDINDTALTSLCKAMRIIVIDTVPENKDYMHNRIKRINEYIMSSDLSGFINKRHADDQDHILEVRHMITSQWYCEVDLGYIMKPDNVPVNVKVTSSAGCFNNEVMYTSYITLALAVAKRIKLFRVRKLALDKFQL